MSEQSFVDKYYNKSTHAQTDAVVGMYRRTPKGGWEGFMEAFMMDTIPAAITGGAVGVAAGVIDSRKFTINKTIAGKTMVWSTIAAAAYCAYINMDFIKLYNGQQGDKVPALITRERVKTVDDTKSPKVGKEFKNASGYTSVVTLAAAVAVVSAARYNPMSLIAAVGGMVAGAVVSQPAIAVVDGLFSEATKPAETQQQQQQQGGDQQQRNNNAHP